MKFNFDFINCDIHQSIINTIKEKLSSWRNVSNFHIIFLYVPLKHLYSFTIKMKIKDEDYSAKRTGQNLNDLIEQSILDLSKCPKLKKEN